MGLLPGDIDVLVQTAKAHAPPIKQRESAATTGTKASSAQNATKGTAASTKQPIAHFGEAAKRSSSRPKARPSDGEEEQGSPENKKVQGANAATGKLLEEIAAEQMFRPTTAKGSKVIRARELCAQAAQSFGAGEFEKAVRAYCEAENLYRAVNDTQSLETILLKRQEAENRLKMTIFQKRFEKERGLALLEDGQEKMQSGLPSQAHEALTQASLLLSKAGEVKAAAEAARLRDEAAAAAAADGANQPPLGGGEEAPEPPNSLVRSAEQERAAQQREAERLRSLKQQEVRPLSARSRRVGFRPAGSWPSGPLARPID
jgi:hypothetical protein